MQAKLKQQAKERQQAALAELKRVAAQQEAAWVQFEQARQAKEEAASAAKLAAEIAKRRLGEGGASIEGLKRLTKGSKKQKPGAKGAKPKGGAAWSECPHSQQPTRPPAEPKLARLRLPS